MANQKSQDMWRQLSSPNEQQDAVEYFLQQLLTVQPEQAQQVITQLCQHNQTLSRKISEQLQSANQGSTSQQGSQNERS